MKKISYEKYDAAFTELKRTASDHRIEFYNMDGFGRNSVNMGVNWAGIGTDAPDEATDFAAKIIAAAKAAKEFIYNAINEQIQELTKADRQR